MISMKFLADTSNCDLNWPAKGLVSPFALPVQLFILNPGGLHKQCVLGSSDFCSGMP